MKLSFDATVEKVQITDTVSISQCICRSTPDIADRVGLAERGYLGQGETMIEGLETTVSVLAPEKTWPVNTVSKSWGCAAVMPPLMTARRISFGVLT